MAQIALFLYEGMTALRSCRPRRGLAVGDSLTVKANGFANIDLAGRADTARVAADGWSDVNLGHRDEVFDSTIRPGDRSAVERLLRGWVRGAP